MEDDDLGYKPSSNLKLGSKTYSAEKLEPLHEMASKTADSVVTTPDDVPHLGDSGVVPLSAHTEALKANPQPEAPNLIEGLGAAIMQESMLGWALQTDYEGAIDPDFMMTEDKIKELGEGIPPEHWEYLADAQSEGHALKLRDDLLRSLQADEDLARMGGTGIGLRLGVAVADLPSWGVSALGAAPGMAANASMKISRLQQAVRAGTGAAAANALTDLAITHYKPTGEYIDVLYSAGFGFGMGAALGSMAKHSPDIAKEMSKKGREIMEVAERQAEALEGRDLADSASAMRAPDDLTTNEAAEYLGRRIEANPSLAPMTAFAKWRFDVTGKLKGSENPISRALGNVLAEDAVGNADAGIKTQIGITEKKERLRRTMENNFMKGHAAAFGEFWKRSRGKGWNPLDKIRAREEFNKLTTRYLRETDPQIRDSYPQEVKQFGLQVRALFDDYRQRGMNPGKDAKGEAYRPVKGFEAADEFSENYVPRLWDQRAVGNLVGKYGPHQVRDMFVEAIKKGSIDIEPELAKEIGTTLYHTLMRVRSGQVGDAMKMLTSGDAETLRMFLKTNAPDLADGEVQKIIKTLSIDRKGGGPKEGKMRIKLDEMFRAKLRSHETGQMEDVSIDDFFVNDIEQLFSGYNRHMSGWISLAQMRIRDPQTDEILIDGIRDQSEWDKLMEQVAAYSGDGTAASDIHRMNFLFRQITGAPEPNEMTTIAQYARLARDFNFMRVMGQVGFAQVAELGVLTSNLGVKATFQAIPSMRAFRRKALSGELDDDLARELDYMTAPGTEWLRGEVHQKWDDFNAGPSSIVGRSKVLSKMDTAFQHGKRVVAGGSGMAPVNALMQRWTAKGYAMRFADMAQGKNGFSEARLRSFGLDENDVKSVLEQFKQHATYEGGKLQRMNLQNWDQDVATLFEESAFRFGRRVIQENDPGQMAAVMGHWAARTILQFRSFMMGAYTKQTLHNLHLMGKSKQDFMLTAGMMVGSSMAAGLSYMAQTHLQAVGRDDKDAFLEKRLGMENIMKASFQRAGYASVIPLMADSGLGLVGQDPMFSYRTTGQPSNLLFGNPTAGYIDDFQSGVGGVVDAFIDDREVSQQEMRAAFRLAPFQNMLPMTMFFNSMIDDSRPERAPR